MDSSDGHKRFALDSPLHVLAEGIARKYSFIGDYELIVPEDNKYGIKRTNQLQQRKGSYKNNYCESNFTGTIGLLECGVSYFS